MGRPKLTPIKKLEKKLTKLVYYCVFARDKSICQVCGKKVKKSDRQPSHVIPKARSKYLRWDIKNIKTLCWAHHHRWWHQNPLKAAAWFRDKFPERSEYLEKNDKVSLKEERTKQGKTYREWLNEKIEHYEEVLSDFGYSLNQPPK